MNSEKILTIFNLNKHPYSRIIGATLSIVLGFSIIYLLGSISTLFMLSILIMIFTIFESSKFCKESVARCDEILLDSVLGGFLALVFALSNQEVLKSDITIILATTTALVGYIAMDRYKPSTIGWLKRNINGALGIVLSSTLAGIAGGFISILMMKILEKFI